MDLKVSIKNTTPLRGSLMKSTTGGSGTDNYNDLTHKPSINGVPLVGNKTAEQLGLEPVGGGGLSSAVKSALLHIAENAVYRNDDYDYYWDLYNAFFPPADLVSISAIYTQSGAVYTNDTLDSLKSDLVVTALYSDSTAETVAAADYTLSGALVAGTSTITVTFDGKSTTFTVTVTQATTQFSVVNALTNCTNSNNATKANEGSAYYATLTPDAGYALSSVVVTMGGIDITSTVYGNGVISISAVTGNVVITASAAIAPTPIDIQALLLAHGWYYDGYADVVGGGTYWTHYGTSLDNGATPAYAIQIEAGKTYTVSTVHSDPAASYMPVAFAGSPDGSTGITGRMPERGNINKSSTIMGTMTSEEISSGAYLLTWTFTATNNAFMSVGCLKNYVSYAAVQFTS